MGGSIERTCEMAKSKAKIQIGKRQYIVTDLDNYDDILVSEDIKDEWRGDVVVLTQCGAEDGDKIVFDKIDAPVIIKAIQKLI